MLIYEANMNAGVAEHRRCGAYTQDMKANSVRSLRSEAEHVHKT